MRLLPFLFSLLFFLSPSSISAHTIIARPTPRENTVHTNASPFECGSQRTIAATYTRGQVIPFEWGRNNHYGGFVQASVLTMAQAADIYSTATRDAFDNPANIIHVSCYNQASCTACAGCGDFFGNGGDGTDFQQKLCRTTLTIPSYLPDGEYVMKSVVFGNGDSFGVRNMAHSSYSNCHNFRIAGGALTTKAAGNAHIEWGAGNQGLTDNAIVLLNRNRNLNLAQGRCAFMGTNTHMGCVPINGVRAPGCSGPIPNLVRCGQAANADTRAECLGGNQENQVQGGDLYNYLLGLPPYHPAYKGDFTLVSYKNAGSVRQVSLNAAGGGNTGGGNTGGGNTGGGAATGTCGANGDCRATPGCCGAGKLCYEKDQFYAGCYDIGTCVPGVHAGDPAEFRTPWSCLVLGDQATTPAGAVGIYWKSNLNRVIDVANAANVNGNTVWMWENYGPGVAQKFEWINGEQIRWQGTDKCLDVSGGVTTNGNPIIIWQCDANNPNQKFSKVGDAIQWKNPNVNKCLDINGGSTALGTRLQIWDCITGNANQAFVTQPLVRSGSVFVNSKAFSAAASLTKPVQKRLVWSQGSAVIDPDTGNTTTFLIVPDNSQIEFIGADSTVNVVKKVCLELFEKGGNTVPCSVDEPVTTLKAANGKISFWTLTAGDYYFMGTDPADSTGATFSTTQRIQISFVEAISSQEIADTLNAGYVEDEPTYAPPRSTRAPAASGASSLQSGIIAMVSVAVAFFFMKF